MSQDRQEYAVHCQCGGTLRVVGHRAGELVQCPNCGIQVTIPPLSVLREQDKEKRRSISAVPSKYWSCLKPKLQTTAFVLGLMVTVSAARELGLFDFHWCRSSGSMTVGEFPSSMLGKNPGHIHIAKIYWVEDDTEKEIWEQRFSESGSVLEVRIRDYFYASEPSLWLPIYKFGTNRAYFYWTSSLDQHGTNCGRAVFLRTSHIFGLCSVRRLREDAVTSIVDLIAEKIRHEATAANCSPKRQ